MTRAQTIPIAGALGAEICGLDLSRKLGATTVDATLDALHEHKVLFFREQSLTLSNRPSHPSPRCQVQPTSFL